jgi:serine/threonine protein kinase
VKRAVKTLPSQINARYFEWESSIHAKLNHPLIVGFEGCTAASESNRAAIVTEFVPNGSLADHLPFPDSPKLSVLTGGTRTAIVVAGMVLAMRYLHSRRIIHRDLKPANVLVDWDWIVRIGDLSHSLLANEYGRAVPQENDHFGPSSTNARYSAPECFNNRPTLKSDVFSFGIILCELLSGRPGLPLSLPGPQLMKTIAVDRARPAIPNFVDRKVRLLISDCWKQKPNKRPSFEEILERLDEMDFRITAGLDSTKVRRFVKAVKDREKVLGIDIEGSE